MSVITPPRSFIVLVSSGLMLLTACAAPTALPPTTVPAQQVATPVGDPCSADNLPTTIRPINDLIRQFDDYAELASNIVQSEVMKVIPPMQAILRSAEDATAPACLLDLKRYALAYMDTTLQTLLAFQRPNPSAEVVGTGIASARTYHDQYVFELARLLGVTVSPATQPVPLPVLTQTP